MGIAMTGSVAEDIVMGIGIAARGAAAIGDT